MENKFKEYHKENPEVYELFKRFTLQAIKSGFKSFGAKTIIERMRWYSDVETKGDQFKINNNYAPYYARLFMNDHPQYDNFFRTRQTKGENK